MPKQRSHPRVKPAPKRASTSLTPEQTRLIDWVRWSGRARQVLYDQAKRYGIPVGQAVIDLPAVARWIHETIADGRVIAPGEDPHTEVSPALERQRAARAELYELELAERRRELMPRPEVLRTWKTITDELRGLAQDAQRRWGDEAHLRVLEAIDRMISIFELETAPTAPPAAVAALERTDVSNIGTSPPRTAELSDRLDGLAPKRAKKAKRERRRPARGTAARVPVDGGPGGAS